MKRFFFCCLIILVFLEGGNSTTIIATLVSSRVLFALDKIIIKALCNISSLVLLSFFCTLSTLGTWKKVEYDGMWNLVFYFPSLLMGYYT